MAFNLTLPFFAFNLRFATGGTILAPLSDKDVLRIGQPLNRLANQYRELFQQKVLNKGQFQFLMDDLKKGDFFNDTVAVQFLGSTDGITHPAFELEFLFYYLPQKNGIWGIIPSLGLEAFAEEQDLLAERLREAVRLEFARKKRLNAIQQIVSAIWFDFIELTQEEIKFKAPNLKELERIFEQKQEALLPKIAQKISINHTVAYGRASELEQITRALKSKFSRNVLLVGPSGVGKTALIWETVRQRNKRKLKADIWETTASVMIKELMDDTGWQDNLSLLCKELSAQNDLLFIRNLMELFEVGKYEGNSISMADYLRTYIQRGEVTLISECTEEELAQIELKTPNYINPFQIIRIQEPQKEMVPIIKNKVQDIAADQEVEITESAILEVIRLNQRFTPYAGLPGKPIRFLESILINQKAKNPAEKTPIDKSEVIQYFCEETGMPAFMVDPDIPININKIKDDFNTQVFGQENAVNQVVDVIASIKTSLTRIGKPIASFLFVGPTGVGKTELAKVLAGFMFGNRQRFIRFDMSEFSSPYTVMRLTGANYGADGLLTSAVRKDPFSVLLFDELEKADANFFDLLLQILSEGRLTDSRGKLVNFCSTIIIMTSNIGASNLPARSIGLASANQNQQIVDHFVTAVQRHFRPELYNRIDRIIPFEPLDAFIVRFVVEREIDLLKKREGIQFRKMDLQIEENVLDYLGDKGYDIRYGARYLQRVIREELLIPLSTVLNEYDYEEQLAVKVFISEDNIKIEVTPDPLGLELLLEELDKINHADHASELRRSIHRLHEGHFYVRLLSELDILSRKEKQQGPKFWEVRQQAEQYTYYLETKEKVAQLTQEIEAIEMDLSLACLNQKTYETASVEALKQWHKRFFGLKVEIYTRLNPASGMCYLAVYGKDLEPIYEFYKALLAAKEFSGNCYLVWFREVYYNEEITAFPDDEEGSDRLVKEKRRGYIKNFHDITQDEAFKPPKEDDELYGFEIFINGPCAYLFLQQEQGIHQWKVADDDSRTYHVSVSEKYQETPSNIHRHDFYASQQARRVIDAGNNQVRDTVYKINREAGKASLVAFMKEILDQRFELNLNIEVS